MESVLWKETMGIRMFFHDAADRLGEGRCANYCGVDVTKTHTLSCRAMV